MEKSGARICSISATFKKLLRLNNRPIGENSPNLVTLKKRKKYLAWKIWTTAAYHREDL
jgi:hypothetical protein